MMTRVAMSMGLATRQAPALAELFLAIFQRDLLVFFPHARVEATGPEPPARNRLGLPHFRLVEPASADHLEVELCGARFWILARDGRPFSAQDRRMVRAIGAVLNRRYHQLFQIADTEQFELDKGAPEDHYVAAFIEPAAYEVSGARPSRIAAAIQALRTAALCTYENHRVCTGALLLGSLEDPAHPLGVTPADALLYGVELTGLKSVHRLCDGRRTLFLVDCEGHLAQIVDIERWAAEIPPADRLDTPCPRSYEPHARATRTCGHVCVVLSPNQEIKLFAGGNQACCFAHGRWRILDPQARYAVWEGALQRPALARVLFQAALDLAEQRLGGLFVVVNDPQAAIGTLVAAQDLLSGPAPSGPPAELAARDPLAKRALHYLARGRNATELAPPVLEALASLDGALVTDPTGRLLAFGAILRHDAFDLPALATVEGARTTAAFAASRFGPVLKVSEDGIISCFLQGARAWDL